MAKYGISLLEDKDNAKNISTSFQQLAIQHLIEFVSGSVNK